MVIRSHSNVIFVLRIVGTVLCPIVVVVVVIQGTVLHEHGFVFFTGIVGDGDIVA